MKNVIGILITTIGVASGIIGIVTASDKNVRIAGIIVIATTLTTAAAVTLFRYYRDKKRESVGGSWDEDLRIGFRVRQACGDELKWISELQRDTYSEQDAVPYATLVEWFNANPSGFFVVVNHEEEPVGHMTILPIKSTTLARYLKEGDDGIIEKEIRGDSLFTPDQSALVSDLYVESIILPKKYRPSIHRAVIRSIPKMVACVKPDSTSGKIYAMAATIDGENVTRKLGFYIASSAKKRRDRHNMYQVDLAEFLRRINMFCREMDGLDTELKNADPRDGDALR